MNIVDVLASYRALLLLRIAEGLSTMCAMYTETGTSIIWYFGPI